MPIDAIEMPAVMQSIETAAANAIPFIISTPNINFLVNSQKDPEFREPLLLSDLCPPDGMPIVWIARLMGLPIKHRIAGSDIFEALKARLRPDGPLKVFLFAAKERVTAQAARTLSATPELSCVAWISPGWRGWKRYFHDGSMLLYLMLTRVLPLAINAQWLRRKYQRGRHDLVIEQVHGSDSVTLSLSGFALASHVDEVISCLQGGGSYREADRDRFLRDLRRGRTLSRTSAHVEEATHGPKFGPTVYGHLSPTGENVSPQWTRIPAPRSC